VRHPPSPLVAIGTWLALAPAPTAAAQTTVAVAANFAQPAEQIAAAFTAATGDQVILSFGATGALYAQITQGAPFTLFLAADDVRPAQAIDDGYGVAGTVFTYAVGKLALYGPSLDIGDGEAVLRAGSFTHVAIAEPRAAPYGAAALEVLAALGLADALAPKLVTGESVGQTLQFVDSGNAELGFVALSQVIDKPSEQVWIVPGELYRPNRQDAVLLKTGADDTVARTFLDFLGGDEAQAIIESYGYDLAH
jgi:molybdate transport system substrate-binding protein